MLHNTHYRSKTNGVPDKFKFFVPIEIQKADDGSEQGKMMIAGIASTPDLDADDEMLDPTGFDLSFFLNHGYFNYNHRGSVDPSSIVGEPTKAFVKGKKLHVEGFLYPHSEKARKVYALAQTLEKSSSNRRLGFSIEGKVVERDVFDPRKVKKAKITGCAITPTPKNSNTLLSLIKGEYDDTEMAFDTRENPADGGQEYIVDVTNDQGYRITIDRSFNIKVAKAATIESHQPIILESVDKEKKYAPLSNKSTDSNFRQSVLTKGDVYNLLLRHNIPFTEFSKIYNFAKIRSAMQQSTNNTLTHEDLTKALTDLGFSVEGNIVKAMPSDVSSGPDAKSVEMSNKTDNNVTHGAKFVEMENFNKAMEKVDRMEKAIATLVKAIQGMSAPNKTMEGVNEEDNGGQSSSQTMSKGENNAPLEDFSHQTNPSDNIIKGIEDVLSSKFDDFSASQDELKENFGTIVKGFQNQIQELTDRLETVESTPVGRRSAHNMTALKKAFDNNPDLEKAYGDKVLSVQQLVEDLKTKHDVHIIQ